MHYEGIISIKAKVLNNRKSGLVTYWYSRRARMERAPFSNRCVPFG